MDILAIPFWFLTSAINRRNLLFFFSFLTAAIAFVDIFRSPCNLFLHYFCCRKFNVFFHYNCMNFHHCFFLLFLYYILFFFFIFFVSFSELTSKTYLFACMRQALNICSYNLVILFVGNSASTRLLI